MSSARVPFLALIALLIAVVSGAVACSETTPSPLASYFDDLESLAGELQDDGDALDEQVQDAGTVEEARDVFAQYPERITRFIEDLRDLDPPPEAAGAHQEAIATGEAYAKQFQEAVDAGAGATTFEDLFAGIDDPALQSAGDAFSQTCLDLQGIAEANDISVNLECDASQAGASAARGPGNRS